MRAWKWIMQLWLCLALPGITVQAAPRTFEDIVTVLKETHLKDITFKDESLPIVMEFLADSSGVNIVLTDLVLDEDITLNLTLNRETTVYRIMTIVGKLKSLKFYYESGVVMVLLEDDYSMDKVVLKVYDLGLLKGIHPTDFPGPQMGLDKKQGENYYVEDFDAEEESLSPEEIKEMIVKFTGGKSWDLNENVKINVKGNLLLVVQSAEVHNEIQAVIDALGE